MYMIRSGIRGNFQILDDITEQLDITRLISVDITEQLENLGILIDSSTTTLSRPRVRLTSPDISFCSDSPATETFWKLYTELQSNQKSIIVQFNLRRPAVRRPRRTFRNYKQADWNAFTTEVKDRLALTTRSTSSHR